MSAINLGEIKDSGRQLKADQRITLKLQMMMLFGHKKMQIHTSKMTSCFCKKQKTKRRDAACNYVQKPARFLHAPPEKVPAAAQQEAKKTAGPIAGFLSS